MSPILEVDFQERICMFFTFREVFMEGVHLTASEAVFIVIMAAKSLDYCNAVMRNEGLGRNCTGGSIVLGVLF